MGLSKEKNNFDITNAAKVVVTMQEEERRKISRELHDSALQLLISQMHDVERFLYGHQALGMDSIRFLLQMSENIRSVVQEIRQICMNLRPAIIDNLGLILSLKHLVQEFNRNYNKNINLQIVGLNHRLLPDVELGIFRIIQESLQNIIRHAHATKVEVTVKFKKEQIEFSVEDNGKGIDNLPGLLRELPLKRKIGLLGIIERVEIINGKIEIRSEKGKGTFICCKVPISN